MKEFKSVTQKLFSDDEEPVVHESPKTKKRSFQGKANRHSTVIRFSKGLALKVDQFLLKKDITKKDLIEGIVACFLDEPGSFALALKKKLGELKFEELFPNGDANNLPDNQE